jgi:glyoxylase I family protein
MGYVSGIGGQFIRSHNPDVLASWYKQHFDIGNGAVGEIWPQEAGPTVFAPFKEDSTYFRADRRFMLNLRVSDIAAQIAELEVAGVAVKRVEDETYGIFAHLEDPDGNPIELWQPLLE